jgi:tRNA A-37 threonylcarbamoyl transferase component Bud32
MKRQGRRPGENESDGAPQREHERQRVADRDLLLDADAAERAGDLATSITKLRAHLAVAPADEAARGRLGGLLLAMNEPITAREVLAPLDRLDGSPAAVQTNRLLALLDEREGALGAAEVRWERVLADDVDDPEARAHLRALIPDAGRLRGDLTLGTLVAPEGVRLSRFRLLRELGRGASAAVYLVRDERLELPLALKVLHPQLASAARADARERFFSEARLAARLRHPGVVAIYDIDEDTRCLAMEFVSGGSLRERMRAGGRAPGGDRAGAGGAASVDPAEVLGTARSLLAALAYVHEARIVHGDLKPGNILLRRPGEIVLADFGIAQFADASPAEERPAGTPLYLAPEQFRGAPATTATDLFAAGALLWEMAQGRPARRHGDLLATHQVEPPLVERARLASLGAAGARLAAIIDGLMAVPADRRPPSARAALAALD